jgi:hypothetical protein
MKYPIIILSLVFMYYFYSAQAQPTNNEELTNRTWVIQNDNMSGIGVHHSLPKGTTIQFNTDGTWQASQLILNSKKGTWQWAEKTNLILKSTQSDEVRNYKVLLLDKENLKLRYKKNMAAYTSDWKAK